MEDQHVDEKYPLSEITSRIIRIAQTVHHELGPGFREVIYQRALALEFDAQDLAFEREVEMKVYYRKQEVGTLRVDFIVKEVMVEIKARSELQDADYVQTLSYLKASGNQVGLLLNFGVRKLQIKRLITG